MLSRAFNGARSRRKIVTAGEKDGPHVIDGWGLGPETQSIPGDSDELLGPEQRPRD
jgi:hypothetical protein